MKEQNMEPAQGPDDLSYVVDTAGHYRPSGRVNIPLFALLLIPAVVISLVSAVGLLISDLYFYMPLISPLFLVVPVCAGIWLLVHFGKCRQPLLGAAVGVALAMVYYLGFWGISYVAFTSAAGPEIVQEIDEYTGSTGIVSYFVFRCKTNVISDVGMPTPTDREPDKGDMVFNFLLYLTEFLMVCGIGAGWAMKTSRRVFYESHGRWASTAKVHFNKSHAGQLVAVAASHNWQQLGQMPRQAAAQKADHVTLKVEYLKSASGETLRSGQGGDSPQEQAYLTLESVSDKKAMKLAADQGYDVPKGYFKGMPLPDGALAKIASVLPELGIGAGQMSQSGVAVVPTSQSVSGDGRSPSAGSTGSTGSPPGGSGQSRIQYATGIKGMLQRAGFKAATIEGPDFRIAAEAESKSLVGAYSMKPATEANASLCLAISPTDAISTKDVVGIYKRIQYGFIAAVVVGFGLIGLDLAFCQTPDGKDLTSTGVVLAIIAGVIIITSLVVILASNWIYAKLVKGRFLNRPGSLFDERPGNKMYLFHLEDSKTYHVGKKVPEDVALCLLDGANKRLLIEGCAHRYVVRGQDVVRLTQLSGMDTDAAEVTYRIGKTELSLVLCRKNEIAGQLNPLIRKAMAGRFFKKIAKVLE